MEWYNDAVPLNLCWKHLPSEKEVQLVVESLVFDEKIGGSTLTMVDNWQTVIEKKEVVFHDDKATWFIFP